jgi:protein gp37
MANTCKISSIKQSHNNLETVWLDASVNSNENINTQQKLRSLIKHLKTFEEIEECEKYIQSTSLQDRLVLIINGDFGQQLISRIHELQQVYSIYIYCFNKEFYQQWTQQYIKVLIKMLIVTSHIFFIHNF